MYTVYYETPSGRGVRSIISKKSAGDIELDFRRWMQVNCDHDASDYSIRKIVRGNPNGKWGGITYDHETIKNTPKVRHEPKSKLQWK